MKHIILLIALIFMGYAPNVLYDFKPDCSLSDWKIVDDTVMGGRSSGNFSITENGTGLFDGSVSLENNGGFSSVRHKVKDTSLVDFSSFVLKLKGDGKSYQFRVKDDVNSYYSYKKDFSTSGDWQEIQLKFSDFTPTYRGRTLDIPNFSGTSLEEMTFLIANKENEKFRLELDVLSVK